MLALESETETTDPTLTHASLVAFTYDPHRGPGDTMSMTSSDLPSQLSRTVIIWIKRVDYRILLCESPRMPLRFSWRQGLLVPCLVHVPKSTVSTATVDEGQKRCSTLYSSTLYNTGLDSSLRIISYMAFKEMNDVSNTHGRLAF